MRPARQSLAQQLLHAESHDADHRAHAEIFSSSRSQTSSRCPHARTQRTFDGARRQLYHDEGRGCSFEQQGRTPERPQFVPIHVNFHYEKTVANGTRAKLESISAACENDVDSGNADALDCIPLCGSLRCISSSQCLPVCAEVRLSAVEVGAVTNCNIVPAAESTKTLDYRLYLKHSRTSGCGQEDGCSA